MIKDSLIITIFRVLVAALGIWTAIFMWNHGHWFFPIGVIIYSTVLSVVIAFFCLSFVKRRWCYWSISSFCIGFPLLVLIALKLLVLHGGDLIENALAFGALMLLPCVFAFAFFKFGREAKMVA